jgi:hypothetical protein
MSYENYHGQPQLFDDRTEDLHICPQPECASDLVQPIKWKELPQERWIMQCRCPNCEWTGVGIHNKDAVSAFDENLDKGTEEAVESLKELIKDNLENEVEMFCKALQAGQIFPEDIGGMH